MNVERASGSPIEMRARPIQLVIPILAQTLSAHDVVVGKRGPGAGRRNRKLRHEARRGSAISFKKYRFQLPVR